MVRPLGRSLTPSLVGSLFSYVFTALSYCLSPVSPIVLCLSLLVALPLIRFSAVVSCVIVLSSERLMIYDVNYMDCNQLATSYIPIFTTPQKKFNHGGCTYTGNLPVSLHSALYLRNYTASNLGELFLYKKNSERYVIDTTAAHTPQAVN